jgi:predicted nucleotidyltransferase
MRMIKKQTIDEFEASNVNNQAREALMLDFRVFMEELKLYFGIYRVLVYGSFISCKAHPSDIDVMVYVCATPSDLGFNKFRNLQQIAKPSLDVFTLKMRNSFEGCEEAPTAAELFEQFNSMPAHIEKGIACLAAVEIVAT